MHHALHSWRQGNVIRQPILKPWYFKPTSDGTLVSSKGLRGSEANLTAPSKSDYRRTRACINTTRRGRFFCNVAAGARSSLSPGVALGDIAIAIEYGRHVGNWLRTKSLHQKLFGTIGDVWSNVFERSGFIDSTAMAAKQPNPRFFYEGNVLEIPKRVPAKDTSQDFSQFS